MTRLTARRLPWWRLAMVLIVAGAIVAMFYAWRDRLTLAALIEYDEALRAWQEEDPLLAYAAALGVYIGVTALSLPVATILSILYGWLFGFGPAAVLANIASTTGATLAMLLSRYLFRDFLESHLGPRLANIEQHLEEEGAYYLFMLRVVPIIPFFMVNVLAGVTRMRVWTFWWVSQLGMLPGSLVFTWAGSQFPSLRELTKRGPEGILRPQFVVALAILGIFPIVVRLAVRWRNRMA